MPIEFCLVWPSSMCYGDPSYWFLSHHQVKMYVYSLLVVVVVKLSLIAPISSLGPWCYQCGTETIFTTGPQLSKFMIDRHKNLESCETFRESSSWNPYAVRCTEFQGCQKLTTYKNSEGQDYPNVVRGCGNLNDSVGKMHPLGCGRMTSARLGPEADYSMHDELCLCTSDYCNKGFSHLNTRKITLVLISITGLFTCNLFC